MKRNNFTICDYFILFATFIISIAIGLLPACLNKYKTRINQKKLQSNNDNTRCDQDHSSVDSLNINENNKLEEYLIGSRNIKSLPVGLSILASIFSSNVIIGLTSEVYEYGSQITVVTITITIGAIVSGFLLLPLIKNLKIITLYEYFELRYNSLFIRTATASVYLAFSILWASTTIYGASTSLAIVLGINDNIFAFILSLIVTIYTAFGGIKGVIWSNIFQLIMTLLGLIYIIIKGSMLVGGFETVWHVSSAGGRLNFLDFSINPFIRQTFWSIIFGGSLRWILQYSTEQSIVQQLFSTGSIRDAKYSIFINVFGSVLFYFLCSFIGLVVYANYANCDPIKSFQVTGVKNANQIFAYFVNDKLNTFPGVSGFIHGSLVSSTLSTVSSLLNSQGSVIWNDILQHFQYFGSFNDRRKTFAVKCIVLICGLIVFLFTIVIDSGLKNNVLELTILLSSVFKLPIGLLFILGIFLYFVNTTGAIFGFVSCFGIVLWLFCGFIVVNPQYPKLSTHVSSCNISIIANTTFDYNYYLNGEAINVHGFKKIYSISYQLLNVIGFIPGFLIAVIVSLLTGGSKNKISNNLVLWNTKTDFDG